MSAQPKFATGDYVAMALHSARRAIEMGATPQLVLDNLHAELMPGPQRDICLRAISDIIAERREPRWLLHKILEANVLAILAGARGTFKSFIALEWAMRIAMDDQPVLILSGEGAGLGMRAEAWLKAHAPDLPSSDVPVVAVERALALTVEAELVALAEVIGKMPARPALIVVDTWSKYSAGLDENSNSEVAAFLVNLSRELRERFGSTVLCVAHTGHGEGGRPRGASALAANTDAEYIVTRQAQAMTVSVSRERFKDTPSLPPLGYEARVVDLGRVDSYNEPVTSLVLHSADAPTAAPKVAGKNQATAMVALREWARAAKSDHITSEELAGILRAQGINHRGRRAETVAFLSHAGILTGSVGGHMVNRAAL